MDPGSRLRDRRHGRQPRRQARARGRLRDRDRLRRALVLSKPRSAQSRPLPGRLDRDRRHRLRPARARPRLRVSVRLHRRADSRHRPGPREADRDRLPPGPLMGRADLALRAAGPARLPERSRRGRRRGPAALGGADLHRPPVRGLRRQRLLAVQQPRAADARLGRPARGDSDLAGDVPGRRRGWRQRADLQLDLLRGRDINPRSGGDLRAAGKAASGWSATSRPCRRR